MFWGGNKTEGPEDMSLSRPAALRACIILVQLIRLSGSQFVKRV